MIEEKKCPSCRQAKPLAAFYKVTKRSDGYASWCKECSNSNRKFHKKSGKRPEYRIVADIAASGSKPKVCPTCSEPTPSHKMRGNVSGDDVKWSCVSCRSNVLAAERQVLLYCDWCCDEFSVPPSGANKRFCEQSCMDAWRHAKRRAKDEQTESTDC